MQVSDIIFTWTPETSGRVATAQIRSRIVGTTSWTEQAANADPAAGSFRFTANAPNSQVEVQIRFRMVSGALSAWKSGTVTTASVTTRYTDVSGRPTSLTDINAGEGGKLGGIAPNADVTGNNTSRDTSAVAGTPASTVRDNANTAVNALKNGQGVVTNIQTVIDSVTAETNRATTALDTAKTALNTDIASAKAEGTQARNDLAAEVTRAKGAEGAITTSVTNLKTTVDGHTTTISDNYTTLNDKNTALVNRANIIEANYQSAAQVDSRATTIANAKVADEATIRAREDGVLGGRVTTIEGSYQNASQVDGRATTIANAKVADEATIRARDDGALAGRATVVESKIEGTAPSGLQTLINNNRKNLIDTGWWKKGATIPWPNNLGRQEVIYSLPDGGNNGGITAPDGSSGDVWLAQADNRGAQGGGWNGGPIAPLDPDKTYRFTVPIARLGPSGGGTSYWGTGGVCGLNTGNEDGNPYFAIYGNLPYNKWYLFVGYLFPRNSTGKSHDGAGVYDMATGERIAGGTNWCFHPDGRQPIHRAYQYYASENAYQAFGRPMVELVDGTETPIFASLAAARGVTAANARIGVEESTRARDDQALATRATDVESKLNLSVDSNLYARVRTEEATRASQTGTLATRAQLLESTASTVSGNMIPNNTYAIWPDGQEIPTKWEWWVRNYLPQKIQNGRASGGYAYKISVGGAENGIAQMYGNGPVISPGWYVFEAEVELVDGTWRGSGMTVHGIYNLNFSTEPDVAGNVSATAIGLRRFTKLHYIAHGDYRNWHPMDNWAGFDPREPKTLIWYRTALRPAGPGDLAGLKNATDLEAAKARIATVETATTDGRFATSQRAETIAAEVYTGPNRNALLSGRIDVVSTATTDGRFAATSRVTTLEAIGDGSSLNANATFTRDYGGGVPVAWFDWANTHRIYTSDQPGRNGTKPVRMIRDGNANCGIRSHIANLPAGYYVLECDLQSFSGNWQGSGMHINFNNGYSYNISFGAAPDINEFVFGGNAYNRRSWGVIVYSGAQSSVDFYAMAGWSGFGFDGSGADQHWHKCSIRAATDGEIKGQKVTALGARVTTTEGAISNLNGRTASYWQTTAVAGNNRAQLTVKADANGGAGVDIVGDVNFSGNLNVGADGGGNRMKITNQNITVFDANGTMRVRMGIW